MVVANRFGLTFPSQWHLPADDRIRRAQALLLKERPVQTQLDLAIQVGTAIWEDDAIALVELIEMHGAAEGLALVSERAGLTRQDVQQALKDDEWQAVAERNRAALQDLGQWGVPSFKLGRYATWGQDRLPIIEEMLAKMCSNAH